MFVLKDRGHLLAPRADVIPQIPISGIASETPDDIPGWYATHGELLFAGHTSSSWPSRLYPGGRKTPFYSFPCLRALRLPRGERCMRGRVIRNERSGRRALHAASEE